MTKWEYLDLAVSVIDDKKIILHLPKNFGANALVQHLTQKPIHAMYDSTWGHTEIKFNSVIEKSRAFYEMIDLLGEDSWDAYEAHGDLGRYFKRVLNEK